MTAAQIKIPLTDACRFGWHDRCDGAHTLWTRCQCSCHHGRTVSGECATWGCDCHTHDHRPGLPYSARHFTSYRIGTP